MDTKVKKFQTILLVVLGVGIVLAFLIFSGTIKTKSRGANQIQASGDVVMWGPFTSYTISDVINEFNSNNDNIKLTYVPKNPSNYDIELLEAFAAGNPPDVFVLPHSLVSKYQDKIILLDENTLPERSFKDLYSSGSDIFRIPTGTTALPVGVDPMVMFYNRDIIESAGLINPPTFWNEDFLPFVQKTTQVASDGLDILVSGAPLGETGNINHAVEIISTLAMQLGSKIVEFDDEGNVQVVFKDPSVVVGTPSVAALDYFTQFSNPTNDVYSWNKSYTSDRDAFASEEAAVYFGFASEILEIQRKNPNLNFDVAPIPQIKEINKHVTYGEFYGLAVPKTASNVQGAFGVAGAFSTGLYNVNFLSSTLLQPVRKDLLSIVPNNSYQKVFYDAAIISRGWLQPNPVVVSSIFKEMVDAINSGRLNSTRAVSDADQKLYEAF